MKSLFRVLLMAFMLVGCTIDTHEDDPDPDESSLVRVGDRLPSFSVDYLTSDGTGVFSTGRLTGRTVIVFFHTSCSDCQRELPELNDYYLRHRTEPGFQMVAIAREEGQESIAAFWQEKQLSIPYSPQVDRRIFNLFATQTIPRVYICSSEGIVQWMGVENFTIDY